MSRISIKFVMLMLVFIIFIHNVYQENKIEKQALYANKKFVYQSQLDKFMKEVEKREQQNKIEKQQEIERLEAIKMEKQKEAERVNISRGGNIQEETFILTFYTSLVEENSKYGAITCNGEKLTDGMAANNVLPQGTRVNTKEFGELTIADRGGSNFNVRNRLDVFIPREDGESDYQYKKRVNNMGIIKVKGYVTR